MSRIEKARQDERTAKDEGYIEWGITVRTAQREEFESRPGEADV
jgi:hypothetical protein